MPKCKITETRIMNKGLAPKGQIYLIVSYGEYKVWRLIPINLPQKTKATVSLMLFHLLQKKYNIYPAKPPSILQRYVTQPITRLWRYVTQPIARLWRYVTQPIARLWNRARKLFRKPAKVVYIK